MSTPSLACIICIFHGDGHSDQWEVIPHCSFDLHFSSVLCDDAQGWDGGDEGGRSKTEGIYVKHIANSLLHTAETNTTL